MNVSDRIKGWLKRIKNSGYRLSERQIAIRRLKSQLDTMPPCVYCRHCPQIALKCPFLPTEQHLEQETTKIKHELNQKCGDCQETIK